MTTPTRLSVVMTHPIQYYAPWFRHITTTCPDIELMVHYCINPTAAQQGVGFDKAFQWDASVLEGYAHVILRKDPGDANIDSAAFFGVDVPEITRSVRRQAPDVVLVPGWYSVSLVRAAVASRMRGLPVLYRGDSHVSPRPGLVGMPRRIRTRALLRLFTHYLTVGHLNREHLRELGVPESRIFFAPHCVDNEFFHRLADPMREPDARRRARAGLGIASDSFVILFAGKLEPNKRPWEAVEAAGLMGPGNVMIIAGSGESEARCRSVAARSGTEVLFQGFMSQSALAGVYGIADCVVLPSESETWGLVVNEALASGLPCVVSDGVGCAPDLIQEGVTGYVTRVGDIRSIAESLQAVRSALGNGKNFSPACRARAAEYSHDAATAGLRAAIDHAVGRRNR